MLPGVYEITVTSDFSAAHRLSGHPGPCARVHGHNWKVAVRVRCRELDGSGMALDFLHLRSSLDEVLAELDHKELNGLPFFAEHPPTAENVARYVHEELGPKVQREGVRLTRVDVDETPGCSASYWVEE